MHLPPHVLNTVRRSLLVLGAVMFASLWAGIAPKAKGEPAPAKITVDDAACRQIVAHRPANDVNRSGAEKGVAPADLSAGMTLVPRDFIIDLRFPLNDVATDRAPRLRASEIQVGTVSFDKDETVLVNGQPASDPAAHTIAEICAARLRADVR
jgi:hypothetical protein